MKSEGQDTKYFASWGGYSIPKAPQKEIPEGELGDYPTYYQASYDSQGRLVRFEKFIDGNSEGYDEYEYWEDSDKLKKQTILNADGETRVNHFNEKGKPVKD
ncbi:MAG: DUF6156 family protein [Cyclobacteriaceae bacterium]